MNFRSDTNAAVSPRILAALSAVNEGAAAAYSEDQWSRDLERRLADVFEHDVHVFTVASGTAANAIGLASLVSPWGGVVCHEEAHIETDECGAPEFYSGGAKMILVPGEGAKVTPAAVAEAVERNARGVHSVQPQALSISQSTERGCVYSPEEVAALGAAARAAGLRLHMDGARFANALVALGCKPAEITWRAGVDVLSFGATKNGAMAAEAVLCFDPALADSIARRRKRGGHLFSKGRYIAAQFLAYLDDDLWLKHAVRANALAQRLGAAAGAHLSVPVESNQVFIKPGVEAVAQLRAAGAAFHDWGAPSAGEARLVVSWNQPESDIEAMAALLRNLS